MAGWICVLSPFEVSTIQSKALRGNNQAKIFWGRIPGLEVCAIWHTMLVISILSGGVEQWKWQRERLPSMLFAKVVHCCTTGRQVKSESPGNQHETEAFLLSALNLFRRIRMAIVVRLKELFAFGKRKEHTICYGKC